MGQYVCLRHDCVTLTSGSVCLLGTGLCYIDQWVRSICLPGQVCVTLTSESICLPEVGLCYIEWVNMSAEGRIVLH